MTVPITARHLFEAAFYAGRPARSPAYRSGLLAHLRYRMKEADDCLCPFVQGSAEMDAWYAGILESWNILERHGCDRRKPPQHPMSQVDCRP